MFVGNRPEYFSRLIKKRIGVELGTAAQGYFEGVGVMIASIPQHDDYLLLLYPAFLSKTDQCCTISNGALSKNKAIKSVLIDTHKHLELKLHDNRQFIIPFTVHDDIDFIKLHIHIPSKQYKRQLSHRHMSLQPISITNKAITGTTLFSYWLHMIYGHRSLAMLQVMIDKGEITGPGLPCKLAPLPGRCPICDAAGMKKLPRGSLRDTTELPIGVRWHIDFCFFNTVSIRGFSAALIVVEGTTRYLWIFPTRSKSAPIDLCLYFFNQMIRRGLPCTNLRCDEDGALVRNTEFCRLMYKDLGLTIESTGGYESTLNGTAESPIRTIKKTVRAQLIGANLPNTFFCFPLQLTAQVHNQVLNRITGKVPAKALTGKSMSIKQLHPFGARVKVLHHLPSKRALSARTSGDLRPEENDFDANAIAIVDTDQPSSFNGRFMGYSNHPGIILVYKTGKDMAEPNRIVRVRHTIVDHYGLSASVSDEKLPNEQLMQQFHNQVFDSTSTTKWQMTVQPSTFDTADSPFDPKDCITIKVTLPPSGTSLGLHIDTDEDFLLPILGRVSITSPLYDDIPEKYHYYKFWVVQVESENPITANGMKEALYSLQQDEPRTIHLTLCEMQDIVRYDHQVYRANFDSCTAVRFAHMVTSPIQPKVHPSIFKCLDDPDFGDDWVQALYHQYDKNDAVKLVSQPTPIENVPDGTKVHRTVISTKVKKKGENLFQFVARMCADGSKQEQGIDFQFSYSPTAGAAELRITIAIAAAYGLTVAIIDIVNCFQSTLIPEEERLVIAMPPLYKKWFQMRYPNIKWESSPSGKYVLRLLNGIQGDKSIGRKWYLLLKDLLENIGFIPCPHAPALFIYEVDGEWFILNTSTDDFLSAFSHQHLYDRLCAYLRTFFDITTKTGPVLSYLNVRIIQSEHGISWDQTQHIKEKIIKKHFPPEKIGDSIMKAVHTPFRTDNQYEIDLMEQLPATKEELEALVLKYGAPYASILGDIMHVWVFSRPDIGYATSRLSQYTHAPSNAAFAGLYRILRHLATHPHRPIFYPRLNLDGTQELSMQIDEQTHESIILPNGLCEVVDADHARDAATRRSCQCVIAMINAVAVHWKMQQQKVIALHSTDSEIRAAFSATKLGLELQGTCTWIRVPRSLVVPTPIYSDSQPAIDSVEANTVTSRVKHIAVPVLFTHQQIKNNKVAFRKIGTKINLADSGTKPNPAPTHFRHFDYIIGVRFYPPEDSEHYKHLELHEFKHSPYQK